MRLAYLSLTPPLGILLVVVVILSGCAVGPNEGAERNRNFWNITAIFSTGKEEVTPVDDPSLNETSEDGAPTFRDIPLIGPLLAAIFTQPTRDDLPQDVELAVDADDRYETTPRDFRVPVRLTNPIRNNLLADRVAPLLKVFHVNNGRLHAFSSPITIRGIAEDANGIASLKINGARIQMRSRVFSKKLHVPFGVHQTLIEAEDTAGNVAYFQFKLVRKTARQNASRQRPGRGQIGIRPIREPTSPPQLTAVKEPGIYMVLMAGTTSAHIVKMPTLKQCREAVQFSTNAACTIHSGLTSPG